MTATDRASCQMCRGPAPVVPTADTRRADGPNLAAGAVSKKHGSRTIRKRVPTAWGRPAWNSQIMP